MVVLAEFCAAHPGEEGLGPIGARTVHAVGHRMVDAVHFIKGVQPVPTRRFVSMHHGAGEDHVPQGRDACRLVGRDEGKRATTKDWRLPVASSAIRAS